MGLKRVFRLHIRPFRRKKTLLLGMMALLLAAGIWRYPGLLAVPAGAGTARKLPVYSVKTDQKAVAVTFDCAWGTEDFDEILGILGEHQAKAAFFMTGGFVEEHPEEVKKLAAAGHDLGNHGDHHKQMSQISREDCIEEIMGAHRKVKNLTGQEMTLFRPPYGDYNDTVISAAEECGYMAVQWNVDSLDWKDYGASDIVQRVCGHKDLKNGSILLLHTGTRYTAQALDDMLTGLEEKGYGFILLSDLLLKENYTIDHEGCQIPKSYHAQ